MAIVADLRLTAPDLFLGVATRSVPDVTASVVHQAGATGLLFSASGGDLDAFERALEADPTVGDLRPVSDVDGRRFFVANATLDRPFFPEMTVAEGIVILENAVLDGTWTLKLQLPDREALSAFAEYCREHDISMRVDRLYVEDPSGGTEAYGLTPAQREVLLVANERGYFDVPRNVTQEELADELGVSSTAVGRRMRRAISTLVDAALGPDR